MATGAADADDLASVTPSPYDGPVGQLSLGGLDEPAEVLVHISSEVLAGEAEPVEIGERVEAEVSVEATAGVECPEEVAEPVPPREGEPAEAELERPTRIDDPALLIRLARIHLKTGSLTMARAELEALAGRGQLNTWALLDLAEVRWRTGDLHGAGEAAATYLADGGDEALGFVIAAEAAALANRLDEARLQAGKALERYPAELDSVFAGIPRKATWPLPGGIEGVPAAGPVEPAAGPVEPAAGPVEPAESMSEADQADDEVSAGRSYLDTNAPMMAALHFGVALRRAPGSARAVLEAIGDRQDLGLQLVRGDALRLLGLEGDAERTYLSVATTLGASKPVPDEAMPAATDSPTVAHDSSIAAAEPEPPAAAAEPEPPAAAAEPEPPAAAAEPEPPAAAAEPEPPAAEPEATAAQPEATAAQPKVTAAQPVDLPPIRWD